VSIVSALGVSVSTLFTFMIHKEVPHLFMMVLLCASWGLIKTPMVFIVGQYAPPASRGAAIGALMGCMSLGFAVGPFVSGATFESTYSPLRSMKNFSYLPFVIGSAVAFIGALTMGVVRARIQKREAELATAQQAATY
jgi:predicted MFS family arabinose efflux permease